MDKIEKIFNERKDNCSLNTSYPLDPSYWKAWKVNGTLDFAGENDISFYLHIPFCQSLCRFCEYVRYKNSDDAVQSRYLDILANDMDAFITRHNNTELILHGLDIGGGTPTALYEESFSRLLDLIDSRVQSIKRNPDYLGSIEATFSTITTEKIKKIEAHSSIIGRVSFGLQNVNPAFLKTYNRENETLQHMQEIFDECRKHGIKVLNIDLMYGFPDQTEADIIATMEVIKRLSPEHLTFYELRTNMLAACPTSSAEQRYQQYNLLYELAVDMGYCGRFGRNTFSRINDLGLSSYLHHRMIGNGSYKGFGIAAQSKNKHGLSYNIGKNREGLQQCLSQETFEKGGDTYLLPPQEMLAKYLAICGYCGYFDLRIVDSIIHDDPLLKFSAVFDFLTKNQYISIKEDKAYITQSGFKYYGPILSLFYPIINQT